MSINLTERDRIVQAALKAMTAAQESILAISHRQSIDETETAARKASDAFDVFLDAVGAVTSVSVGHAPKQ